VLQAGSWPVPPIFHLIAARGVSREEMPRVFNMGLGFVLVLAPEHVHEARRMMPGALLVGEVRARAEGEPPVVIQ
jgi:phosphoribosylformylglycinamidine cyclo-ligase